MRCYYSYIVILILVAVVVGQVFCDEATTEIYNREKRQEFREPEGQRGPPYRREGGEPDGHRNDFRGPQGPGDERFAQPHRREEELGPDGRRDGNRRPPRPEDERFAEPHRREEEGPGGRRDGNRRPPGPEDERFSEPHRREEERPEGHREGPRRPQGPEVERFAQSESSSPNGRPDDRGNNGINNAPTVEGRFGEMQQDQGSLGYNNLMGFGMGLGGSNSAQSASQMGFQAARQAAMLGNGAGGYGGMSNLGGFGAAQDASSYGFRAAQNAANGGSFGGMSYPSTAVPNSGLSNLGGQQQGVNLLSLGGQSNGALINIGGPGLISLGGQNIQQTTHRPQGPESNNHQQGRPGNNSPGQQGSNRPSGQQSARPGERPGQHGGRPSEGESFQNGRPEGGSHNQNPGHSGSNGRPNGASNDEHHGGGSNGHPSDSHNQGGGGGGGGNKKCRGNQWTCRNRECVARNARCNGVHDCRDRSDEFDCNVTENRDGGEESTVDRATTAAPHGGHSTSDSTDGCILPEQPTGGSYELGSCQKPCRHTAGHRVPITSFLTYKCNNGYTLNGNNVSFCHDGAWYLPPTCVKTCSPLKSNSVDIVCKLDGKTVSCESAIAPGTTATLACKPSFKIPITDDPAYRELNCLEEGIWDRTLFRCLPECGTAVSHGNTLIVNGFTAKLGVFPWHCGIYQKNGRGGHEQICAGSLISPSLVISAAHCFYDDATNQVMDASQYAVAAGKHYRLYLMPEKYAQTSTVKSIEVASRYFGASGNFAEDIALVTLTDPFTLTTLVRPVCMDWENVHEREQFQSGQSGKAVGWGKTAEGEPSTELQEINLPYIPYQECVSAVPEEFKGYVTADKFCAGYLNGSSLCEGDSGGGLCFQLNGLWYLRGIVSVSPVSGNTCDNNYYTAFTNVGRFREWIRNAYVNTS